MQEVFDTLKKTWKKEYPQAKRVGLCRRSKDMYVKVLCSYFFTNIRVYNYYKPPW